MWWSDDVIPRWIDRLIVAAVCIVAGFFVPYGAFVVVMMLAPSRFLVAAIYHAELIVYGQLASGAALALLVDWMRLRRAG